MLLGRRAERSRRQGQSMSEPFAPEADKKGKIKVAGARPDYSL